MSFREVEENLRRSFRSLAAFRAHADVLELPGVDIASLGVSFQMFNAAFLNSPVETPLDLEERLFLAKRHFARRNLEWSFWVCEDLIAGAVRKKLSHCCSKFGLRIASEMPGMVADRIAPPPRPLPRLDYRRADSMAALRDFRAIGSVCFNVPLTWFSEVFDDRTESRPDFVCWVGYRAGVPVATAATFSAAGTTGLYNVATLPEFRSLGYGEAITRHALEKAAALAACRRMALESTALGVRIYERIGFRAVTRVLAYNSTR
jgi:GNAT superfamily N-acetyltransferase